MKTMILALAAVLSLAAGTAAAEPFGPGRDEPVPPAGPERQRLIINQDIG